MLKKLSSSEYNLIYLLPFLSVAIIDYFYLKRGQFDVFNIETIAIFYSSANSFFNNNLYFLHYSINHHPQNINTFLSIIFYIFFENNFKNFVLYTKIVPFFNLLFLLVNGLFISFVAKEMQIKKSSLFLLSLISACTPGVLAFSITTLTGYYSYGIILVGVTMSSYIIINNKDYRSFLVKLSIGYLGFALNISYVQMVPLVSLIIIYFFCTIFLDDTNKNKSLKSYDFNKWEKLSLYLFFISIFFFLLRAILYLVSIKLGYEGNYYFYQFGQTLMIILTILIVLPLVFVLNKIKFIRENILYFLYPFSVGWLIGSNIMFLGWFLSFFTNALNRGTSENVLKSQGLGKEFFNFSNFLDLSVFYYFIIIIFVTSIFLCFINRNYKNNLLIIFVIIVNIFMVSDIIFNFKDTDGYNTNRFLIPLSLALTYFIIVYEKKLSKNLLTVFLILIPLLSFAEYFKLTKPIKKEINEVKLKSDEIIEDYISKNNEAKIFCLYTFIPDRCNFEMSKDFTNSKSNIINLKKSEKFVVISFKDIDKTNFSKGDLLISGKPNNQVGETLLFWDFPKNFYGTDPYLEIKKIN